MRLKSHGIKRVCKLFSVTESAYYAYVKRLTRVPKNLGLQVEVKALFEHSRASAGSRSILAMLRNNDIITTRYQVIKAMKEQQLISKQPSKKWRHKPLDKGMRLSNTLEQRFDNTAALCADITYIKVANKWHYLSTIMESSSRRLVSWDLSDTQDTNLVIKTLDRAIHSCGSYHNPTLFHSDQGSVYGSNAFVEKVKGYNLKQSMSKRGYCWDNAIMERWYRSFKSEWMPKKGYDDIDMAKRDIAEYVRYYNFERPHQKHQGLPPMVKLMKKTLN